jgi:DNA invertase Pin-like site-specific DNA recombinase
MGNQPTSLPEVVVIDPAKAVAMPSAFAYLRVSGKAQVKGDGFPRQRKAIQDYAKKNDIRIARFFEEKGISGKLDIEHRPALDELIKALHANGTRIVIIERLDRLARDIVVQESIIRTLIKQGFTIISTCEPDMGSEEPARCAMRQMLGVFAELDRKMLVRKLSAAKQRIFLRTGKHCEGRKPFGDRPGEAATLAHIKDLRAKGLNYEQLARELNTTGSKTRSGGNWFPATIRRILSKQ